MRKQIILSALLLFSIISLAQSVNTEIPITGLGEFELGITKNKFSNVLEKLTSDNPKASDYLNFFVSVPNLDLMNSTFDHCVFYFDEDRVYIISFTKYFDDQEESSDGFDKLLNTLEESYGKQSLVGNKEYTWKNGQEYIQILKGYDQMKNKESVSIICSTGDIFSLLVSNKLNMYGLGSFQFNTSVNEVEAALEDHITPNTKITKKKKLFSSEVKKIILTNVTLAGYRFDYCELEFDTDELRHITFEMYFDKNNKNPKEFEELLTILENDYGKQDNRENKEDFSWFFSNDTFGWLWLTKSYDKDSKRTTIIVDASASTW